MTKDDLTSAIGQVVHKRTEEIATEEIAAAQARIETRVRAEVGRIACSIFSELNYERFGRDLRITIRFPEAGQ